MWGLFFLASATLLLFLFMPGYASARVLRFKSLDSLLVAPMLAIALYELVAIGLSVAGVFVTGALLLTVGVIICICCCIAYRLHEVYGVRGGASRKDSRNKKRFSKDSAYTLLFFLIVLLLATWIYVVPLDGPSSFAQDSDNTFHLSLIKSFVDSGNYSALSVSLYHDMESSSVVPVAGGFYPAAWHLLAAFVSSLFQQNAAFASNVVNYVILFYVFPSGVLLFMRTVISGEKGMILSAALVLFAFGGFPWGTLVSVSGPLFPNTLGLALVLPCAAVFVLGARKAFDHRFPTRELVSFVSGVISLGVAHPSSVFTLAVVLAPYLVYLSGQFVVRKGKTHSRRLLLVAYGVSVMVISLIWVACYLAPPLRSVTSFTWAPTADLLHVVINAFTLAYRLPFTNYLLAALVVVGFVCMLARPRQRWFAFSYLIAVLIYAIGASSDGLLQHLVSGFWYTDPYRTGASASLLAIPLAAVGLSYLVGKVHDFLTKKLNNRVLQRGLIVILSLVTSCLLYMYVIKLPNGEIIYTGLGYYNTCSVLSNSYDRANLFDENEKDFCSRVSEVVDSDAVIYNNADDGSSFAYPLYGLNLLYRRSAAELLGSESEGSKVLRLELDELSVNDGVKSVLKENNIKYILNLDTGGLPTDERCYYGYYAWDKWPGINSIDDETPGLKILISEGDMRLYEIVEE